MVPTLPARVNILTLTLPAMSWGNTLHRVLVHFLELGEQVEANKGCCCHADKVKYPAKDTNLAEKQARQARVRARHEKLNGRLKN
jgi:hypothetical protein